MARQSKMHLSKTQRVEARKHIWRKRRQGKQIPFKKILEGGIFPNKSYQDLKLLFTMEAREIEDEERRKHAALHKLEERKAREAGLLTQATDAEKKLQEAIHHAEMVEAKMQEAVSMGIQKARKAEALSYAIETAKRKHEEVQEAAEKEKRRVELLLETLKSREKAMSDLKQQYDHVSKTMSVQAASDVKKWKDEYDRLESRCRLYEQRLDLSELELQQKYELEEQMIDASEKVLSFQLSAIVEDQVKDMGRRIARLSVDDMVMKDIRKIIIDEVDRINSNARDKNDSLDICSQRFDGDLNDWWNTRCKLAHEPKYDETMDHTLYQEVANRILDNLREMTRLVCP